MLATLALRQELTAAKSKHLEPRLGLLDDARIGRCIENWAGSIAFRGGQLYVADRPGNQNGNRG